MLTRSELNQLKRTRRLLRRKLRDTKSYSYSALFAYFAVAIAAAEELLRMKSINKKNK